MSNRIKELAGKIVKARHDYYNGSPSVSDSVFDAWVDELTKLDPDHPAVTAVGAPVVVTEWKKAKHLSPMGSLNKVNTPDEFKAWARECSIQDTFGTEKLDGISINTIWENGKLIQAITRGNGQEGEDITVNVAKMKGVPKKLSKSFSGSIRGEIVLLKSDCNKYFPEYSNPRNAASGVAKRYDGKGPEHLTVIMYTVADEHFDTEIDQLNFITKLGLNVPNYWLSKTISDAIDVWNKYQKTSREKLDYDIDGLVFRVNKLSDQFALGEKNHRPKGAVAFKFEAAACETTLRNIVWQVGNSGRITPVAEFDMVNLAGAKIERASLYNLAYINELGLDVGAKVIVIRANDVIPRVEEVSKSTGTIAKAPTKCPECSERTQMAGEYLVCINKNCPAQKIGRLNSWVSELNILDWSDATLQRVIDAGLVNDVADLYKLKPEQMENLDRMGKKLAQKLVNILDEHREIPLQNFIGGLGIEGVATSTSKSVVDAGYDTVDAFLSMSINDFESIPGFGSIRANTFYNGLRANRKRINDILAAGVKIKAKPKGSLTGKSFCFSGASSKPRAQLHKMVEENGGDVKKSVGRGLNYLVVADPSSGSSKTQAAHKLGIKIIGEDEFVRMCS